MRTRSGATAEARISMAPPKKGAASKAATPARPRSARAAAASVRGPKYSVLLPTYNERENVALVVSMLVKEMEASDLDFEIVVIDDASPDGTADVVRALADAYGGDRIILKSRPGKLGLGTAYAAGLELASGDFVVIMDADLSHHPKYIPDMVALQSATGADVVTGTRYARGGGVAGWSFTRKLTSCGANVLASLALRPRVSDLTGSFRLWRADLLRRLVAETRSTGYAFQMEVVVRAVRSGATVAEVPIVFVDRLFGSSKLGGKEIRMFLQGLARLFFTT